MLAEVNRDRKRHPRAFRLEEFMVHEWPSLQAIAPPVRPMQTAEQQRDILKAFFDHLGAVPEGSDGG